MTRFASSLVLRLLLTGACGQGFLAPAAAQPVWQWRDANGLMVFSDRPPPPHVSGRQILRQPGSVATPPPEPSGDRAMTPATSAQARAPAAVPERPTRNGETMRVSPSDLEEARLLAMRADNCLRARQGLAAIQAGQRMSRYTEQGERLYLDEAELSAETLRLEGIVQQDCR